MDPDEQTPVEQYVALRDEIRALIDDFDGEAFIVLG